MDKLVMSVNARLLNNAVSELERKRRMPWSWHAVAALGPDRVSGSTK